MKDLLRDGVFVFSVGHPQHTTMGRYYACIWKAMEPIQDIRCQK